MNPGIPAMGEPHFRALLDDIRGRGAVQQVAALDQMGAHGEKTLYQLYISEYRRVRLATRRAALRVLAGDLDPDLLADLVHGFGGALADPARATEAYALLGLLATLLNDPLEAPLWSPEELAHLLRDLEVLLWDLVSGDLVVLLSRTLGVYTKAPRILSATSLLKQRVDDSGVYQPPGELLTQLRLMARVHLGLLKERACSNS